MRPFRILAIGGLAVAAAVVVATGWLWLQERPLGQAEAALVRSDPELALKSIDAYLVEHPRDRRALSLRARTFVALGRPLEGIRYFEQVGAADAQDVHAWARAYLMLEQWSAAHPLLIRVLEMEPKNADALYEISSCRTQLGLYHDALESAQRFAELPGSGARGYLFVGSLHHDLRNDREAAKAYAKVLEFEPEAKGLQVPADQFLLEYGRTLLSLGSTREALPLLERSVKLRPAAEAYLELGNAFSRLGQAGQAREAWEQSVRRNSTVREARESLANAALQEGNGAAALEWLEPLKSSPSLKASTAYLFQRAHALARHEEGVRIWREKTAALRAQERHEAALENLVLESPQSGWGRAVRAHRFASKGNWREAQGIVEGLIAEGNETQFVQELAEAVRRRGPLPAIEKVPITQQ